MRISNNTMLRREIKNTSNMNIKFVKYNEYSLSILIKSQFVIFLRFQFVVFT